MQRWLASKFYYGWVMVASALMINTVVSPLNPVIFSFFIGPMTDDLNVGKGALSWALTLRLVTGGLAGPLVGILIDRHGTRALGIFAGISASIMLIALSFASELWVVYLIFAISGLTGLGGPAGQLLTQVPLAKWFVAKRGRAMAIAMTGGMMGTVVAIPIAQWLIETFGWRDAWIVFGATLFLVVVPVSALLVRRQPEDMGLHPDGSSEALTPQQQMSTSAIVTDVDWTVGQAFRTPALWFVLGALTLAGVALTGTLVHRTAFWREAGMSPNLVAFGTAMDPFTVIFSAFAFGMMADKIPTRYLGSIGLGGLALSILPMIFTSGQAYTIIAHNVIWGAAAGAYVTVNSLIWPNYFGRKFVGTIRGITLPLSIGASGAGAPLFGYLLGVLEPEVVWTCSLVLFVTAGLLILLAKPPVLASAQVEPTLLVST